MIFWMMILIDDDFEISKNHQNHDFWDDVFDVDFVDDSFDVFVDGLQDALPSPYNVKLARYGLLTIQTGALRSPYNSNWFTTFLRMDTTLLPSAPPGSARA